MAVGVKKILVLCTGNSCRSQMAEAYLRVYAGNQAMIYSAGVEAHGLNPRAVQTMQEDGIDISGQRSKLVDEVASVSFDFIITVCDNAKERCPYFPSSAQRFHQAFTDPAKASGSEEEVASEFRMVREQIKEYAKAFVTKHLG